MTVVLEALDWLAARDPVAALGLATVIVVAGLLMAGIALGEASD